MVLPLFNTLNDKLIGTFPVLLNQEERQVFIMREKIYQLFDEQIPYIVIKEKKTEEKNKAFINLEKKLGNIKIEKLIDGKTVICDNSIYISRLIEDENNDIIFITEKNLSELQYEFFASDRILKNGIMPLFEATEKSRIQLMKHISDKNEDIKASVNEINMAYMEMYSKVLISDILYDLYNNTEEYNACDLSDIAENISSSINQKLSESSTKILNSFKKNCIVKVNSMAIRVLSAVIVRNFLVTGYAASSISIETYPEGNNVIYTLKCASDTFKKHDYKCYFDTESEMISYDNIINYLIDAIESTDNIKCSYTKSDDMVVLKIKFNKVSPLLYKADSEYLNSSFKNNKFKEKYSPENAILYSVVKRETYKGGEKQPMPINVNF